MRYLQKYNKTPAELAEILRPWGVTGFIVSNSKTSIKAFCSCGKDIKEKEISKCPHCGGRIETFSSNWSRGTKRFGQTYELLETPDKIALTSHNITLSLSADEVEVIVNAESTELFTIWKNASNPIGVTLHNNSTGWEMGNLPSLSSAIIEKIKKFAPQFFLSKDLYLSPLDLKIALKMQSEYPLAFFKENYEQYPETISKMHSFFQRQGFISSNKTAKYSIGDTLREDETIQGIAYTMGIPFELKELERIFSQAGWLCKVAITSKFEEFLTTISGSILLNRFNHHSSDFQTFLRVLEFYNNYKEKKQEYELNVFEQFFKEHIDIYDGGIVNEFEGRKDFLKKEGISLTVDNIRNRNYFARINGNAYKVLGNKTIQELMDEDPLSFITSIRR